MDKFFFLKENSVIDDKLIVSLVDKFDKIFNQKNYETEQFNVRELNSESISKEQLFQSVMNKIHKKFKIITNMTDLKFKKLWLVNSKSNSNDKSKVPYVPHIDKNRYLKAMIYLNDVSISNGPIHLGKAKNNIDIENIRINLPHDYKVKKLNVINNKDLEKNLIPMTGKAGDVIFFDTNTPHKAGNISEGYYRKILRFDFERPSFIYKENYTKKLFNKLRLNF
jgi:ectoine hydroxylase-related dioxygenase (phytanoyl-CoA dioxygenase family)